MPSRRAFVVSVALAGAGRPLSGLAQSRANAAPADPVAAASARKRFGEGDTLVGVLVPPLDGPFARASASLLAGVAAAHARDGKGIVVEAVEVDDQADQLSLSLADLHERRAALVIGPMTRNGATALVELGAVPLPTLALNLPDGELPVPARLSFFGLAIEAEARQAAAQAYAAALPRAATRRPRATIVAATTPLARRGAQAFRESWAALGGEVGETLEFDRPLPSRELRARITRPAPDVLMLSMRAEQARVLRGAVGAGVAVWSTSLASIGNLPTLALPELDGLRVLEMPWLVDPDNASVKAYAKAPASFNIEMQRLYALGIDAFRVGRQMIAGDAAFELDGVTGRLAFDRTVSPRVERVALPAEYRNGRPAPLVAP